MTQESKDSSLASLGTSVENRAWLLLIYRVPKDTASARTSIWREARRLGALSLQHAIFLLPLSAQNRLDYERLCRRIEEYGGEATLLETASPSDEWHERTVARFNAARDEEYQEVVDEAERVREEIERERRKGKFTFAELEDVESQLERVRKYLGKAEARDVFGAAGHAQAVAATDESGRECEAFAQQVYACQRVDESG
jgi:hypothetical protein